MGFLEVGEEIRFCWRILGEIFRLNLTFVMRRNEESFLC